MAKTHETVADIIAEIRALSNPISDGIIAINGRSIADRIEAAHKREMSKICPKTGGDFGQLGDASKLREALEFCVKGMCGFCRMDAEARGMTTECVNGCEALRKAKAALAAPPRNCDRFASAEEAWDDYDEWVDSYRAQGKTEPFNEFGWLFAPATEKEGGNDGR